MIFSFLSSSARTLVGFRAERMLKTNFCSESSSFAKSRHSYSKIKQLKSIHTVGIISALCSITGIVAMSPLDDFEKNDLKNDCYHNHLHPR
mmetsp:Transcript_10272/g.13000  ORF Transcript_10272/g.13000 Transcript_10272/m.13000 type:complete len:91 (-) Transcript_10272:381-653(-)